MSITTNSIVTFQDLYNSAWSYIKNRCRNIDKLDIPAEAKTGWSRNNYVSTPGYAPGGGAGTHAPDRHNDATGGGVNISIDNNTAITQYSSATVEQTFKNFLSSRGVYAKQGKVMTSSGIIMFWTAVASFYSSTCVTLVGEFFDVGASCIVYYPTSNYTPVPSVVDAPKMSNNDVNTLLNSLLSSLNMTNRVHKINYNLTPYSSSSSSSSSSCSSSSYIGYIKV